MADTRFQELGFPSARDLLYVVFKYKTPILTIFFGTVALALIYTIFATPMYQAEAKVLVKLGRQQLSALENFSRENYNVLFQERGQNINNEIEIFKGSYLTYAVFPDLKARLTGAVAAGQPSLLARIARGLGHLAQLVKEQLREPLYLTGLATRLSVDERLALAFHSSLHAEFVEDTDIVRIEFVWPDPEFAAYAVNAYTDAYLKRHIEVHAYNASRDFYIEQIERLEEQLTSVESELEGFRLEGGISNIELQKDLLLREISEIRRGLVAVDGEIGVAESNRDSSTRVAETGPNWLGSPRGDLTGDMSVLDTAYYSLVTERSALSGKFKPAAREIQEIDAQQKNLRQQKLASIVSALQIELHALQAKRDSLLSQLHRNQHVLAELNASTRRLKALEREQEIVNQGYLLYKNKAEELRLVQDLDSHQISSVKVLSPATSPLVPAYPRKMLILMLAGFLGVFGGFAYAVVAESFNRTFRDEHQVRRLLGVPLLATIPAGAIQDEPRG